MNLSLAQFTKVAQSNWFNNDIVLSKDGQNITSKFFHTKSSNPAAQVTNKATMDAFRTALRAEFGSRGEAAFAALEQKRGGHSLRKNDVLNTIKLAQSKQSDLFSGVKTMNEFHGVLREVFGRYGEMAFQDMKKTNLDMVLNKSVIKNTVKLAQQKKTAEGNVLRTAANDSLDKIFADRQRPYHNLPAKTQQQLRGKIMEKFEALLQMDDMRVYYLKEMKSYEVRDIKRPQFPEGMDGFMSHDIQDAAKDIGREDLAKADPIFKFDMKYETEFNVQHAADLSKKSGAEPINEGWVDVEVGPDNKETFRDIDL